MLMATTGLMACSSATVRVKRLRGLEGDHIGKIAIVISAWHAASAAAKSRNASKVINASRWPERFFFVASIKRSTSPAVRCSRVRRAAFWGRRGVTVRFSVGGETNRSHVFSIPDNHPQSDLFNTQSFYEQYQGLENASA